MTDVLIFTDSKARVASQADVLRGSSRVPAPLTSGSGTRDEPLRTSAWEANYKDQNEVT